MRIHDGRQQISNYAFKRTAELALGSNQVFAPQPLNAALGLSWDSCAMTLIVHVFLIALLLFGMDQPRASAVAEESLTQQVQAKSELAVAQFQERAGGRLDYGEGSVVVVEEMLAEAAEYVSEMDRENTEALIELMGCYLLEVARRKYGGEVMWHEGKDEPVLVVGEPKFHVALMTFGKIRGRLSGDESDNIEFFYKGFSGRVKSATPGLRAIYL